QAGDQADRRRDGVRPHRPVGVRDRGGAGEAQVQGLRPHRAPADHRALQRQGGRLRRRLADRPHRGRRREAGRLPQPAAQLRARRADPLGQDRDDARARDDLAPGFRHPVASAERNAYNNRVNGRRAGMVRSAVAAVACAWVAAGCDGSLVPPQPQAPLPSASLCQAAAGTTLLELGVQDSAPASMFWTSNSSLSFPVDAPASIQTLPLGGGPPVVLTTAVAHHIWLANGGLVFSSGGDDKVWQIPIGGGDPTLIADGMTTGPPSYNAVGADTYDAADFYWDLRPSSGPPFWSLWAMAIPGGGAKKLADLPEPS